MSLTDSSLSLTNPTIARLKRALTTERKRREALAEAKYERFLRRERQKQTARGGLIHFIRYHWSVLEPGADFIDGWPLWAICQHLEAVSRGEINRLLINCPPGSMKSLLCNVFWPAWHWAAFGRPDHRFINFSYAAHLTERDNQRMLDLLKSMKFKDLYGDRLTLTGEGKVKVSNSHKGWKFASSVGGVGTGERGNFVVLDDPHNIKEGESKVVRDETVRWFREAMSNRLNDMVKSAIVIIMQRVHADDVTGAALEGADKYCHLKIPMEFEPGERCKTSIGWSDPRVREGECFWPERFPPEAVLKCRAQGPYAWASQYQQSPEVRGGGLLKRDYWRDWSSDDGRFPACDFVIASLDGAFTAKEENDPSALTVWGTFTSNEGDRSVILLYAFRKWLELHGPEIERLPDETKDDYRQRCEPTWGLVEHVADVCRRFRVKHLLIENKASGITVSQEMQRLYRGEGWSVELYDPKGLDKTARVIRIQPVFSEGQVYAPDRKWAKMVIDECAVFPRGKHDDLVDSTSAALWHLRNNGFLNRREERRRDELEDSRHYKQPQPLYPT
jgi:predicted phage terminase large subunit-like protein